MGSGKEKGAIGGGGCGGLGIVSRKRESTEAIRFENGTWSPLCLLTFKKELHVLAVCSPDLPCSWRKGLV